MCVWHEEMWGMGYVLVLGCVCVCVHACVCVCVCKYHANGYLDSPKKYLFYQVF